MKTISQKISILFLICLISLAITGYAYSDWTDIVTIFGTANMAHLEITLDDQKLIPPEIGCSKTPDNKTLTISADIKTGWQIWVGTIIKNKGKLPVAITYELTRVLCISQIEYRGCLGNETHFYGPYTIIPPGVWDDIDGLNPLPPGEEMAPIDLPADDRLVVWQKLWLEDVPPEDFTITVTSEYFATFSLWQDTVVVIYHLAKG